MCRKWEERIAAERAAGEARIAKEKAAIAEKIEKVKASLAEQYEEGFKPLLQEAEQRHMHELQRVVEQLRISHAETLGFAWCLRNPQAEQGAGWGLALSPASCWGRLSFPKYLHKILIF